MTRRRRYFVQNRNKLSSIIPSLCLVFCRYFIPWSPPPSIVITILIHCYWPPPRYFSRCHHSRRSFFHLILSFLLASAYHLVLPEHLPRRSRSFAVKPSFQRPLKQGFNVSKDQKHLPHQRENPPPGQVIRINVSDEFKQ